MASSIEGDVLVISVQVNNHGTEDVYSATLQVDSPLGNQNKVIDIAAGETKLVNFQFAKPEDGEYTFSSILVSPQGNSEKQLLVKVNGNTTDIADSPIAIGVAVGVIIIIGAVFLYPFFVARKQPFETERGREHLIAQKGKRHKKLF